MRLISYNPRFTSFDRTASLQELLNSAFAPNGGGFRHSPPLDVHEDSERVTVSIEAPGLKKEDFEISLHDGALTVSGERKSEVREGETLRSERFHGRFSRTVALPAPVRSDAVTAVYADGILTVTLPKSEEAKPRKITVS